MVAAFANDIRNDGNPSGEGRRVTDDAAGSLEPQDTDGMFAMWVGRLAAHVDEATFRRVIRDRQWATLLEVAKDWHVDREERGLREIDATARGLEYDRMAELMGYVESVSERFGLALAAGNEVALWRHLRSFGPHRRWEQGQVELSQRAMASLHGYYLLATGHNLAAVAIRCLALEPAVRPTMEDQLGTTCDPGSTAGTKHWPSLNSKWCRDLRKVAQASAHASQVALAEMISEVAREPSWIKLDEVRGEDYHRGRPPSAPMDGAPIGSAWLVSEGHRSLSWDRDPGSETRAEDAAALMMQVEQILASRLLDVRSQIEVVIDDVLP